uniref:Bifunctional lysine-specific demethylase and histidyl-hydroxylase n=1 Tax=Kalanchoe fedtschenkoi TaxID=63787 RepID=A0A7N0R8Z8_KALFE
MKRKRSSPPSSSRRVSQALNTISASIAASFFRRHHPYAQSLLRKRLKQLRQSLISENPLALPSPVIALLPALLTSECEKVASCAAEIVGLGSLSSFEMNETIAMDGEIMKGLIRGAVDRRRSVAVAACNAILDLSSTLIGRRRLLEFSALESLMFGFCQVLKLSEVTVELCNGGNGTANCVSIVFVGDELQKVVSDIVVALINTCNQKQLQVIQGQHAKNVLVYLKELWRKVCDRRNTKGSLDPKNESRAYICNAKPNNLAESIFRLSMNVGENLMFSQERVRRSFFGISDSGFRNFIMNHWEESSFVLRSSECSNDKENIFDSFVNLRNCKKAVSSFLSDSLRRMVSCLPFASDNLDILDFLKEVKETIGCPIIYQQDIRVIRTDNHIETHYLPKGSVGCAESPDVLCFDDFSRCEEGYKHGYTIALRGLEFRFEIIASIADAIASMFGQPSVGANLYLSPSNSQGLARHYDDHCVFVFQLIGEKQWTVSEQPTVKLPRLYEPLLSVRCSDVESDAKGRNCLLMEGDVLYIPRGLAHEAYTTTLSGELDASNGLSLHLTIGIEVEPPFEWEGFAHVALHCWQHNQDVSVDAQSLRLLHFAIRHIGHSNPDFRKACLAAAIPLESNNWLEHNQIMFFTHILNVINTESSYSGAVREFEATSHNNEYPFRWLKQLDQDSCSGHGPSLSLAELSHQSQLAEATFLQTKSNFCDNVVFADVLVKYKLLLSKYRNARKQYTKGMLSLHCFNN